MIIRKIMSAIPFALLFTLLLGMAFVIFSQVIDGAISVDKNGQWESKIIIDKCYDKYGSEIQELTCENKVQCSEWGFFNEYKCNSNEWNKLSDISGSTSK